MFAASKAGPANAAAAMCLAAAPTVIEIVAICAANGLWPDVYEAIVTWSTAGGFAGLILSNALILLEDDRERPATIFQGVFWGMALGATLRQSPNWHPTSPEK